MRKQSKIIELKRSFGKIGLGRESNSSLSGVRQTCSENAMMVWKKECMVTPVVLIREHELVVF